ncbi:hypothetical protein P8452_13597 [Trifolium repens]|nr:hypothetical protein P8452_13597 [Trifolium repens]
MIASLEAACIALDEKKKSLEQTPDFIPSTLQALSFRLTVSPSTIFVKPKSQTVPPQIQNRFSQIPNRFQFPSRLRSLLFKPNLISVSQTLIASKLKPLIFTPQIFNFSLHTQIQNRYSSQPPQIPNRFQFLNLTMRLNEGKDFYASFHDFPTSLY